MVPTRGKIDSGPQVNSSQSLAADLDSLSASGAVKAAALLIGNEILAGKIQEKNLFELAKLLRSLGVVLDRVVMIPDEEATIAEEVTRLSNFYNYVFTSGGVGPTHDDVTMAGVARAFGVSVVRDPLLEQMIRDHHDGEPLEGHLNLARVPEGARMLTATTSRWPIAVIQNVWILPGIPEVFMAKLKIIQENLTKQAPFVTRVVYTKLDEVRLKPILDETVANHPEVDIGSYPDWNNPKYKTKITFDAKNKSAVERAFTAFIQCLPNNEPQWTE